MDMDGALAVLEAVADKLAGRGDSQSAEEIRSVTRALGASPLRPPHPPPRRDLLTTGEAARRLGVRSVNTVKSWVSNGLLDGFKMRDRLFVSLSSVENVRDRLGLETSGPTDTSPPTTPDRSPVGDSFEASGGGVHSPGAPCPQHPGRRMTHPLFAYYGEADWPVRRILVVGYEPGDDLCMHDRAGELLLPLNAPAASKVTFWTKSHLAISWAAEICGLSIWPKARLVRSSPIAYTDASPHGSRPGGGRGMTTPTRAELVDHAERLLALPETQPDRCPVVIFSGRDPRFTAFYDAAESHFRRRGTAVVNDAPFFGRGATKAESIGKGIAKDRSVQAVIHDVVSEWGFREGVIERRADGKAVLKGHRPCSRCR